MLFRVFVVVPFCDVQFSTFSVMHIIVSCPLSSHYVRLFLVYCLTACYHHFVVLLEFVFDKCWYVVCFKEESLFEVVMLSHL